MRLALPALLILLVVLLVMFALTNDTRVDVTLGSTTYSHVHLSLVVLVSVLAGAALLGILALIEGASIRLDNRRLRREIQRLETESTFLRTQRSAGERREPDELVPGPARPELEELEERWREGRLPSAPVYDTESSIDPD